MDDVGACFYTNTDRGGLGHYAVMFAHALGADVSVISHSPSKKDDALKLGANTFISSKDKDWHKPHEYSFDFIINTADNLLDWDMTAYFQILKVNGHFHNVGYVESWDQGSS
jgi:alcohol dehydrogenase (NADP+)